jgi:NDP-sugar pyrophosphorylase family protein
LIRQINLFIRKGIKEIIICAGYKGKFIIDELEAEKHLIKNIARYTPECFVNTLEPITV